MEQHELLGHVCRLLERLGVRYMVTGSQATIAYGEPRFTNDIDIVVDLNLANWESFCEGFPPADYYWSRTAAVEAVTHQGMFNVIHPTSGLKIDVIVPKADGYDQLRLNRAIPLRISDNLVARMTTAEDIILKKLEWHQMGGGERHLRDIAGVVKIRGHRLDFPYIEQNAQMMGVSAAWREILQRLQPSD